MIRALWDVCRSFFVCLPPNQCQRVLQRAIRRASGFVLRLDHSLLVALLYGNDIAQAEMDELLVGLRDMSTGSRIQLISHSSANPYIARG